MLKIGVQTLKKEGVAPRNIDYSPVMDLRYVGQYHEVQLSVPWEDVISFSLEKIRKAFHNEHNRLFGYSLEEEDTEIEMINVRLRVLGKTEKPRFVNESKNNVSIKTALKEKRPVYIPESNEVKEVPVYDGDMQLNGNKITGPAIIEKVTTSIFISESYDCLVDDYGSFIVYNKEKFPDGFNIKKTSKNKEYA